MSSPAWYWHRLRAMSPSELAAHGRRKICQISDRYRSKQRFARVLELPQGGTFPVLRPRNGAPADLRAALARDAAEIGPGRWIAFGYLPLQVDNPPRWHKDYLAGIDMATERPALKLHHRLEGEADIKLIWEPNRWYSLVRLAQAAYVLDDPAPAQRALRLLEHWVEANPPYYGWNWTSALETGLRLIQFTWMDALLSATFNANPEARAALARLRPQVLLPHLWFTWRDRSFGSSANNHLIGELSGLILTLVRWPDLAEWAAPLPRVHSLWEAEVLKQFAPDGGNREQALNYHLFSFEFCWQARLALLAAKRPIRAEVEERLQAAADYFTAIQVECHPWDYGDSDSAFVTPVFSEWQACSAEWHRWLAEPAASPAVHFWIGEPPKRSITIRSSPSPDLWRVFPESGFAACATDAWNLRWDLSPLGYLATASHGHCDALHLSLWHRGEPIVIDPGTGTYHYDRPLRDYLSSWDAHNGPHPSGLNFPERRGAFLWSAHHPAPRWTMPNASSMTAELTLPSGKARRTITRLLEQNGWQVDDAFEPGTPGSLEGVQVFWQLPPGAVLTRVKEKSFLLKIGSAAITIELSEGWTSVTEGPAPASRKSGAKGTDLRGFCSSAFRRVEAGPWLLLEAEEGASAPLRTTFRTCEASTG